MNELKTESEVKKLVKYGYGLNQMLEKIGMSLDEMCDFTAKHLELRNILEKRYKINLTKVGENSNAKVRRTASRNTKQDNGSN